MFSSIFNFIKPKNKNIEALDKKIDMAIDLLAELDKKVNLIITRIDIPKEKQGRTAFIISQPVEWVNMDPSKKKPTKLSFNGEFYFANSWLKVLETILEIFYNQNPEKFKELPKSTIQGRSTFYFSTTPDNIRKPKLTLGNIYFETNLSANLALTLLRSLFDYFGEDYSSMQLFLKGGIDNDISSSQENTIEGDIDS